jgi:hypothetical protein
VNTAAQFAWTNTHTFSANVSFNGNGIGIVSNTGAVYLGGLADANWRIGRNTGATTKRSYTNNTIDVIVASSADEGFVIGVVGGNTVFETGYKGTLITGNVSIGNSTVFTTVNATSFSGAANSATFANSSATNTFTVGTASYFVTNGNLGIGTSNPIYTLDVAGIIRGQAAAVSGDVLIIGNDSKLVDIDVAHTAGLYSTTNTQIAGLKLGSNGVTLTAVNDRLGISNTTPDATLAVTGTANVSGNVVVGGALNAVNVTATVFTGSLTGTASNATNLNSQPGSFYTNATNLATGTVPTARLGTGTANSTTFLGGDQTYKTAITSVDTGSGLTGGAVTTTGTISVLANNGITANSSGLFVAQGTGAVVNATGVHVNTAFIATLTANNTSFVGSVSAANVVSNAQLQSNLANYQTTTGLSANVATLTANAAGFLGNSSGTLANVSSWITGNSATAFTNATAFASNASNLSTGTVPTARLGSGTANSTTFLSGDQSYKTAVTSVASGNGLTGGSITTTGTLSVQANNGIIANTSGLFVHANTGVTVNSTGVHIGQAVSNTSSVTFGTLSVTGNSALGDAAADIVSINGSVNTSILPSANITYGLGSSTMRWSQVHVANVNSITGRFDGNVEIGGNLTVTGNVSNVSVVDLIVNDPLIHIGANNEVSDLVDLGWVGHYSNDGGTTRRHAGLFRDASDGIFKFFTNLVQADLDAANAITINTAAASYSTPTVQTFLSSGALTSNTTAVTITANSTVNVAIVANTVSGTFTGSLTGTASNATNLDSQPGSFYTNANNLSTGTLNNARLPSNINVTTVNAATLSVGTTVVANSSGLTTTANASVNNNLYSQTTTNRTQALTISVSNVLTANLAQSNFFSVTLDKNVNTLTVTGVPSGVLVFYIISFNIQGSYSIAWPASFKWPSGTPPTISNTVNDTQTFVFYTVDGGTTTQAFNAGYNR